MDTWGMSMMATLDTQRHRDRLWDWGQVLPDQAVATANLDRLLHHATVVKSCTGKTDQCNLKHPTED